MTGVEVRYFAAARDAAGLSSETVAAGDSLAVTLARLRPDRPAPLAQVLATATFLVDGERRGNDDPRPLADGSTLDVLPPFAGG